MKHALALAAVSLTLPACAPRSTPPNSAPPSPRDPRHAACETVLQDQAAAWNRGDMDGYAAAYHRDPAMVFVSGSSVTQGYQALYDRMKKRYPDRAAMGQLTFAGLTFRDFGQGEVLVEGTWKLKRAKDRPWGRFVLVMRKVDAGWRVVVDYTNLQGK